MSQSYKYMGSAGRTKRREGEIMFEDEMMFIAQ